MLVELTFYIGLMTSHNIVVDCPSKHNDYGFPARRMPCAELNETNHLMVAQYRGITAGTMINSYNKPSVLAGYTHALGSWEIGVVAATGYTDTPMRDYTVAGLLFYPTVAYNFHLNEHIAFTAITTGVVNNFGVKITF